MSIDENPFKFLEQFDVNVVAGILSNELPFVAGAALSRTSALFNAKVMANMPDSIRNEIASAISKYRSIPTEVLYDIAEELEKKLSKPAPNPFSEQKNSILANLDLGSIMNNINNLKVNKNEDGQNHQQGPAPVESRVIRPEDTEAFLRGESIEDRREEEEFLSSIVNPDDFIPTSHTSTPAERPPSPRPASPQPPQETAQRQDAAIQPDDQLDPKTRKELALQQALLHTRTKKQETRSHQKQPARPASTDKKKYKAQKIDGMALAAHILRESSPELRKLVMNEVPELYSKLNDRMFDFADLEQSSPDTIGKIFTGIEPKTCALALRFSSDQLKNTALTSVSRRKATLIIDEFKRTAKERVRLTDIEDAQQEVIDHAVQLQNKGEIIIDPNDSSIV